MRFDNAKVHVKAWLALPVSCIALLCLLSGCGPATGGTSTTTASTPTATVASSSGSGAQSTPTVVSSQPTTVGTTTTSTQAPTASNVLLQSVRMVSGTIGWATANKTTVLRTTDGGNSWSNVTPNYTGSPASWISTFTDGQHGWIAYEAKIGDPFTILRTSDGGQSWQSSSINTDEPAGVVALRFSGNQQGWLMAGVAGGPGAGHEGFGIFKTNDGGQSWSELTSVYKSDQIGGISLQDASDVYMAYGGPYDKPQLSASHDGGKNWQDINLPAVTGGLDGGNIVTTSPIFFGSTGYLPISLDGGAVNTHAFVIYQSHDGGKTWHSNANGSMVVTGSTENGTYGVGDLYIVDPTHAYVTTTQGVTLLSQDGGVSWKRLGNVGASVSSLSFTDSQHGWAAGGGLWRTNDGGASWQQVSYTVQ